ncbi:Oidioi.mRNA.OKI2018_I69.PAR.g8906.t1.cds [Oikopleura dioica]|uniref:Fucosyltransferase n=1 Tax=Oikopleura dioica TaxID=34765 RepID=A0ABN7RM64_OIKDI|nr:Oidioi.mRNA.OKI2018_I69.PAR.g8906.t1.cds [Oikopleura dioica]
MKINAATLALFSTTEAVSLKPWRVAHSKNIDKKKSDDKTHAKALREQEKLMEEEEDVTLIMNWSGVSPSFEERKTLRKLPERCGGCWLTNDRTTEKTAHSIIFDNTRYFAHMDDVPDLYNRNQDQYWVFFAREAASKNAGAGAAKMEGQWDRSFNLTSSYRLDSDVPRPYGDYNSALQDARYSYNKSQGKFIERISGEGIMKIIQRLKQPTGENHTAWLVSNCEETRGAVVRKEFTDRLVKHGLKLDGYGECYDNVLVDSPWKKPSFDTDTYGPFTKYKFYLAFENSIHCNDYMSEKFWRNSLNQFMVPIVYGPHPDDVKAVAPPNSYIHVEDYSSPHELVKYLDYLDRNMTAYMEYHSWRFAEADPDEPNASKNTERMYCGVCKEVKKRKNLGFPKKIIPSVASWWWMNVHDDQCISGQEMPKWLVDEPVVTSENMYDELKVLSFNNGKHSPK